MGLWLSGPLRDVMEVGTRDDVLQRRGIVSASVVKQMRQEHLAGQRDRTWHLWALMVMEQWFEKRIDRLELPQTDDIAIAIETLETPA